MTIISKENRIKYIVINLADNEMIALRSKAAVARYCNISRNSIKEGLVKHYIIKEAQEGEAIPMYKL